MEKMGLNPTQTMWTIATGLKFVGRNWRLKPQYLIDPVPNNGSRWSFKKN